MSAQAPEKPGPARSRSQRRIDVRAKLRSEVDCWVSSADEPGGAHLLPLSYCWDDSTLTIATPQASRTARNLVRAEQHVYLQITPHDIQAWREANELEGRRLMRRGEWLE
jgi:nitroimidazol reductase NimA-like FMN-containing flavoprotein (pyridoxamine 5'-phosphate oxidase superfamily)